MIHVRRQLFLDDVGVLCIRTIEEPHASFCDRTGKCDAGIHFVKDWTIPVLHGRDEICDCKAKVIISRGSI